MLEGLGDVVQKFGDEDSWQCLRFRVSQTHGRIQKVDPLTGVPIKYP